MAREPSVRYRDRRFVGLVDNPNAVLPEGTVREAVNAYLKDGRYRPRNGVTDAGTLPAPVQKLMYWQNRETQVRYTMAVAAGNLYQYDWAGTWNQIPMGASDPDLDASSPIGWVSFKDQLVITDGVNTPFTWDGTDFLLLTDAPVAAGVTVYYFKLFFYDLPLEPSTFMWSEEGLPNEGYLGPKTGGGNHDNAWDFSQTDPGRILELTGLNEQLVVFKEDSVSAVRGPVEEDFRTTGVREGISETEGLYAADSVVVVDGDVHYLAAAGPRVIPAGSSTAFDTNRGRIEENWKSYLRPDLSGSIGVFDSDRSQVWWTAPLESPAPYNRVISFALPADRDVSNSDQGFSFFKGWSISQIAQVENDTDDEFVMFADDAGNVFLYGDDTVWDDDGTDIESLVTGRSYGADSQDILKSIDKLGVDLELETEVFGVSLSDEYDGVTQAPMDLPLVENEAAKWGAPWGGRWPFHNAENFVVGVLNEGRRVSWRVEQTYNQEPAPIASVYMLGTEVGTEEY
jgi:hypothetical protein